MNNKIPKIAIIGYGAMGKELESIALEKGFQITNIFEIDNPLSKATELNFDVALDFSTPESVMDNIKILAENRKNIVIGTTGWYDKFDLVRNIIDKYNIGAVWGSNFSIGTQLYLNIIQHLSLLIKRMDNFDIGIEEIHHKHKKDFPSGTSINIAKTFIKELFRYNSYTTNPAEAIQDSKKIPISSLRTGEVVGIHKVILDSEYETLEFSHIAKNRRGFAVGALEAARWVNNRTGFYGFEEVISTYWT
jgi:4-hydroxy-tetrahydrodipicolinate reductase